MGLWLFPDRLNFENLTFERFKSPTGLKIIVLEGIGRVNGPPGFDHGWVEIRVFCVS